MDAFVSGASVVLPSGSFATNPNSRGLGWESGDHDAEGRPTEGSPSGPRRDREAELAERTTSLIPSYERYISGTGGDEEAGDGSGSGQPQRDWDRSGGGGNPAGLEMQDHLRCWLAQWIASYMIRLKAEPPMYGRRFFSYPTVDLTRCHSSRPPFGRKELMDARGGGRGRRRRYGASLLRSPAFGQVCLVLAALAVALPALSAWENRRSDRFNYEEAPAMEWPEEETPGDAD
ncbi:hypothetical protein THAOC_35488, partial [Thalassiosira oceanica]